MIAGGYILKFEHTIPWYTICRVYDTKDSATLLSQGEADCNERDNFDRKVGRKIALSRALMAFPKEVRGGIWRDYKAQARYE